MGPSADPGSAPPRGALEGPLDSETTQPLILLAHDGELADVRALLQEFRVAFVERRGRPTAEDDQTPWDLVVASPKRLLELRSQSNASDAVRVVIIGKETRTLSSMLRRAGIELMVRRPVHPPALRLLLLHAVYRGPEKRRRERVAVGAPIQFRTGLRKRQAMLADISIRGCRLLSLNAAKRDQSISVLLTPEVTRDKPLKVAGKVVRTGPASGEEVGTQAIAVAFEPMSREQAKRLSEIVRGYAGGPAVLSDALASQTGSLAAAAHEPADAPAAPLAPTDARREPSAPQSESASPATADTEPDRRSEPRREYDRSVIALGEEATRVLIGRDISMGGMRVDPNDSVSVGDHLRVALHVRARTEPLVVQARVDRDDGEAGLLLVFHDLSDGATDYLNKMVNFLPILAARGEADGEGVFVSEILEQQAAGEALSDDPAETPDTRPDEPDPTPSASIEETPVEADDPAA